MVIVLAVPRAVKPWYLLTGVAQAEEEHCDPAQCCLLLRFANDLPLCSASLSTGPECLCGDGQDNTLFQAGKGAHFFPT